MNGMYRLLEIDGIRSIAASAVRKQAAVKRAIDPNDPLARELEYQANRIDARFCVKEAEMRQFGIEHARRMAQTFFEWAEESVARSGRGHPTTRDAVYHAHRIEGLAQEREHAWEADRIAATVRDRQIVRTIADASREYAELLLAKDPYDPLIEEIIRNANHIERLAEEEQKHL